MDKAEVIKKLKKYKKLLSKEMLFDQMFLFGSYANGKNREDSDIDLAVFIDKEDIKSFDENLQLMKLTSNVDLSIEPNSFARTDFDEPDPFVNEIITTGERII